MKNSRYRSNKTYDKFYNDDNFGAHEAYEGRGRAKQYIRDELEGLTEEELRREQEILDELNNGI